MVTDGRATPPLGLPDFDITAASSARIWNYWVGGKDHFAADREAAERVREAVPVLPMVARHSREFLAASVRMLAADYGVRQFLDIGTGLPTSGNTHEVAQAAAPESRIVYVDYDPVVLRHAQALLTSSPQGQTDYIQADLRDTGTILAEAAQTLDFSQPIAVLLINVLHFVPDGDDPAGVVARLMGAVPYGSFLVMVHGASDRMPEAVEGMRRYNEKSAATLTLRSTAQVTRFFDGLDILDTGSGAGRISDGGSGLPSHYGIGRKRNARTTARDAT